MLMGFPRPARLDAGQPFLLLGVGWPVGPTPGAGTHVSMGFAHPARLGNQSCGALSRCGAARDGGRSVTVGEKPPPPSHVLVRRDQSSRAAVRFRGGRSWRDRSTCLARRSRGARLVGSTIHSGGVSKPIASSDGGRQYPAACDLACHETNLVMASPRAVYDALRPW